MEEEEDDEDDEDDEEEEEGEEEEEEEGEEARILFESHAERRVSLLFTVVRTDKTFLPQDDSLEEIDPSAIIGRRTRGKRVDYTSAEAIAKAQVKPEGADDDEDDQDVHMKED
jgi:hypothetical protein